MKKILAIFTFILILLSQRVLASEIKFVQVTDSHYSKGNEYSGKVLKAAVKDINSLNGVSFVVFTGDNINKANEADLVEFTKIVNKLNVPYYIVIGNHDVFKSNGLSKERYLEVVKENNILFKQKTPDYYFRKGEFGFLIADGAKEIIPGANGYFKQSTLDYVDKKLAKHKNQKFIIFQHFPLIQPYDSKTHSTYKAEEYLARLNKHSNVVAVVSGHFHVNNEKMQDGIYHINTPSLLKLPHQYKIIDINITKGFSPMIYTQLREVYAED